jgi:hypothetical protein
MFVMSPEEADTMKKSGAGVPPSPAPATRAEPPLERIDFYRNLRTGTGLRTGTETGGSGGAVGGSEIRFGGDDGGGGGGGGGGRVSSPPARSLAPMDVSTLGGGSMGGSHGTRGGAGDRVVDTKAVAAGTVVTLAMKMEEARAALAANRNFSECAELIKFIEQCATAIKTCEGV